MKLESNLPSQSPWLFLAPLLTVVLLLAVYFLLSSGFILRSGVTVQLPESPARLAGFEAAQIITVAPGSPIRLFLNGLPVTSEKLATQLAEHGPKDRRAVIYADRDVPFGEVAKVGQTILSQHFEVAYATAPEANVTPTGSP